MSNDNNETNIILLNENSDLNTLIYENNLTLVPIHPQIKNIFEITFNNHSLDLIVKQYSSKCAAKNEIYSLQILEKISGIPKMLTFNQTDNLNFVIMTKIPGVDLLEYSIAHGPFSEQNILPIVKKILIILAKIHQKKIIHRDIKPENILYDEKSKKVHIIDFENRRTPDYSSPEQKQEQKISSKTDLYSLGITIYFLVADELPAKKIIFPKEWSDLFCHFLTTLLRIDPQSRYSAKKALRHAWLQ